MQSTYVTLVVTALIVMGSPGPVTIGVTAAVTAFGLRRAVPYLLGSMTGTAAALVVVAAGLASVLLALPGLGPVLLVVSVAYLAWLAWKIATARPPTADEERPRTPPTWLHGLLLGVAIPKGYAAVGASMAAALRRPRVSRAVNVVLAAALLASTVPLVLELAT